MAGSGFCFGTEYKLLPSQTKDEVITDDAGNMKLACSIFEQTFPHIYWTPSVIHCLNLALKSMCQPF